MASPERACSCRRHVDTSTAVSRRDPCTAFLVISIVESLEKKGDISGSPVHERDRLGFVVYAEFFPPRRRRPWQHVGWLKALILQQAMVFAGGYYRSKVVVRGDIN